MCRIHILRLGLPLVAVSAFGTLASSQEIPRMEFMRATRTLSFMSRPEIRSELALVDAQIEDMIHLEAERKLLIGMAFSGPQGQNPELRARATYDLAVGVLKLEEKMFEVLLPHQRMRLEQIMFQDAVGANEPTAGLTNQQMIDRLGLVEPQLQVVRAKAKDADTNFKERLAELNAEIEKAKEAARSEVLKALTPDQLKQYQQLIGQPFDPTNRD